MSAKEGEESVVVVQFAVDLFQQRMSDIYGNKIGSIQDIGEDVFYPGDGDPVFLFKVMTKCCSLFIAFFIELQNQSVSQACRVAQSTFDIRFFIQRKNDLGNIFIKRLDLAVLIGVGILEVQYIHQ